MPAEKLYMKASENRRSNKPIMEKRRRARINHCLNDLKTLILEALKKDPARHSKLEKADILEMTVKHLQNLQRQQMAMAVAADPTVLSKYRAGYNECANEVSRYVSRLENVEPAVKQRLLSHLTQHVKNLQSVGEPVTPPMTLASLATSYPLHLPGATSMLATGGDGGLFRGLQLIPTRLANGDIVFLLPGQTLSAGSSPFNFSTSSLQSKDKPLSVEVTSEPPSSPATISLSPELQLDSPTTAVAQDLSMKLSVSRYQENLSPSLSSPSQSPNSRLTPPPAAQDDPKATLSGKDPWRPW